MQKPRWLTLVAVLSVFALVGAACGDDGDDGGGGGDGPEPGALGTVEIGPDDPLEIGVMQVITGDNRSLGEDQVRAIQIAVDDKGGELLGHEIELQTEDSGCSAEGGTAAAENLVDNEQIVGVLGSTCSGEAVPAAPILLDAGIVMISGSNTSPFLTALAGEEGTDHQENYFRTAHNDEVQGAAAAQFALEECGVTKAASIHDGDPYTSGLAGVFNESFEDGGGELVLATSVSPDDENMVPVLTEVAGAGAELIFFPIFQPAGDFIAAQAREVEGLENTVLMGADGLLSDTYVVIPETKQAPGCPNLDEVGMYFSGPAVPEGPAYGEFVQKYEEANGEKPIAAFHAHSYDAANMLFAAIEEVAEEQDGGGLVIDRQALIDAVGATSGFEGLTGTLTCDEFGDCAAARIQVFQNTADTEDITAVKANILFDFTPAE